MALELEKSSYKKLLRYSNTDPYFTEDGISKSTSLVLSVKLMYLDLLPRPIYQILLLMELVIVFQYQRQNLMDTAEN